MSFKNGMHLCNPHPYQSVDQSHHRRFFLLLSLSLWTEPHHNTGNYCFDIFYHSLIMLSQNFISDQISRSVVSDSLQPHESQHTRPPPSMAPGSFAHFRGSSMMLHVLAVCSSLLPIKNAFVMTACFMM